jgi:hypothetical protein
MHDLLLKKHGTYLLVPAYYEAWAGGLFRRRGGLLLGHWAERREILRRYAKRKSMVEKEYKCLGRSRKSGLGWQMKCGQTDSSACDATERNNRNMIGRRFQT